MENNTFKLEPTSKTSTIVHSILKKTNKKIIFTAVFLLTAILSGCLTAYLLVGKDSVSSEETLLVKLKQSKKDLKSLQSEYRKLSAKMSEVEKLLVAIEEKDADIYRNVYGMEEIPDEVRMAGFGGTDRYSDLLSLPNGKYVAETAKNMDMLVKRLEFQSKSLAEIKAAATGKEKEYASIPAIQPIAKKDMSRVASGFGQRFHPILKINKMHKGLDFAAPTGTPIYATADGRVESAGSANGYGNMVKINHGNGFETLYGHMSKIKVRSGQRVKRGDIIGNVGNTGMSTGSHLHYEIHKNGEVINPLTYFYKDISPDEFVKLYEESQKMSVSLD